MNVSNEDAQASLADIEDVMKRTRKVIASTYTSPFLILWGLVWIVAFLGTHFFTARANFIWMTLNSIGVVATFLISRRQFVGAPAVKNPAERKFGLRIFWFWILVFGYAFIWLAILTPQNGLEMNAFLCTAMMFAYVVLGLWLENMSMVVLGLAVTAVTLAGFYLVPHSYYCIWMALLGGGALLGTGLYMRIRWRR